MSTIKKGGLLANIKPGFKLPPDWRDIPEADGIPMSKCKHSLYVCFYEDERVNPHTFKAYCQNCKAETGWHPSKYAAENSTFEVAEQEQGTTEILTKTG